MDDESEIILWRTANGEVLHRLTTRHPIRPIAVSPDATLIAVGEQQNGVRVWDVGSGKELHYFQGEGGHDADFVTFSPDGKTLAAAHGNQIIELWDVSTWKLKGALKGHQERVLRLAFSPDSKVLYSAGLDSTIRFWDVAERREIRRLGGFKFTESDKDAPSWRLAIAPDGKTLVAGRMDGTLSLVEMATGKELRRWKADLEWVRAFAFSPDGKILASTFRNGIRLWDPQTGKRLDPFTEGMTRPGDIHFSPDGKFLAVADDSQTLRLIDAASRKERVSVEMPFMSLSSVAISPNSRTVAFAERPFLGRPGELCRLRLLDVATGKEKDLFRQQAGFLQQVAFWPAGDTLTARSSDQLISWDMKGKELKRWQIPGQWWTAGIAFSPDGRTLARDGDEGEFLSLDAELSLWDTRSGKKIRSFGEKQQSDRSLLIFSPDGKTLASARGLGGDGKASDVILWEVASGKERCRLKQRSRQVTDLVFTPDGSLIATAARDNSIGPAEPIHLWEAATGEEVGRLSGHSSTVESLAFSPDGKVLVSGSCDTTILFWDPWTMIAARKPPAGKLDRDRWNGVWRDLKEEDGVRAYQAIDILARSPNEAIAFLRQALQFGPVPDVRVLARLISDLDDDNFATREQASAQLARIGPPAGLALRRALEGKPSAEARRRLTELVTRLEEQRSGPERLRTHRVIETLERIGTAEAKKVLQELRTVADWPAVEEAQAALDRLSRRTPTGAFQRQEKDNGRVSP